MHEIVLNLIKIEYIVFGFCQKNDGGARIISSCAVNIYYRGERGYRRSIGRARCGRCWAAGEYVADCHASGELSLV